MSLPELIMRRARLLTEGSVYELLRRDPRISFDPSIAHAGLIYDSLSRELLEVVHRRYIEIAAAHELPILAFTDTWRASAERIAASSFRERNVNRDNVLFLREIASAAISGKVFIAGMSGPRDDAYRPNRAPRRFDAVAIHRQQIEELADAGVDVLFAATLPSLDEALGIAELMATTSTPWMLSFIVRPDGTLLDGSPLTKAIETLDTEIAPNALGFSINCVHPSIAARALTTLAPSIAARVVALQGNTSDRPPEDLDGQSDLHGDDAIAFAASIMEIAHRVPVVGGCCGTDASHMKAVAAALTGLLHLERIV
jgi:homocysteine S-methyltransferase